MADLRKIGEQIRAARRAKGLAQEALADLAGVCQSAVSQAERGRTIGGFALRCLLSALGLSAGELPLGAKGRPYFARLAKPEMRDLASRAGKMAHALGRAHKWTRAEAAKLAPLGGKASQRRSRAEE